MITKKTTKAMEKKLLKIIFEQYTSEYGYGVRNLKEYKLILTGGDSFEKEMPEIVEYEGNVKRYLLLDILKELMARGHIECSEDNCYYWLSESGYKHASKSFFQHIVGYYNDNSGWAIPIAIVSLVVSLISLFVK